MASGTLTPFTGLVFEGKPVRIVTDEKGNPWFMLIDVCKAVEIGNVGQAATRLDDDEKSTIINNDGAGGPPRLIVSEPGLYKILQTSNKPEAKRLDRLVRHEVLPSIRKYGCYPPPTNVAPSEMDFITQMVRSEIQPLRSEMHAGFNEIKSQIKVVVDNTGKNRKYATVETIRIHYKGICHHYFMFCPCETNCGTKIADENGFIEGAWHHHHQFGPWDNSPEAMIPLAVECHQRITNDKKSRKHFDQTAFPQFQDLLARMPVKQLTLDLKPSKD